jgi:hypothetical protein
MNIETGEYYISSYNGMIIRIIEVSRTVIFYCIDQAPVYSHIRRDFENSFKKLTKVGEVLYL